MAKLLQIALFSGFIGLSIAPVTSFADETFTQYSQGVVKTTKLKSTFATNKDFKGSDISVTTVGSTVTLTGTATNEAQKTLAGQYAKETKGVKNVVNQITVEGNK